MRHMFEYHVADNGVFTDNGVGCFRSPYSFFSAESSPTRLGMPFDISESSVFIKAFCCFSSLGRTAMQSDDDVHISPNQDISGTSAGLPENVIVGAPKDVPTRGLSGSSELASQSNLASSDSRWRQYQTSGGSNDPVVVQTSTMLSNALMNSNQHSLDTSAAKLSVNASAHVSAILPAVPEMCPAMDIMLVVSLIQELVSHSISKSQVPRSMALLCTKLNVTWACLTAFSSSGQHFQHCGAAHVMNQERLQLSHPGFLACLENVSPGSSASWGSSEERYSYTSCSTRENHSGERHDFGSGEGGSTGSGGQYSTLPKPVSAFMKVSIFDIDFENNVFGFQNRGR